MNTLDKLRDILARMQAMEDYEDSELAHQNADAMLLETMRALAGSVPQSIVDDIVEAYGRVNKWYS